VSKTVVVLLKEHQVGTVHYNCTNWRAVSRCMYGCELQELSDVSEEQAIYQLKQQLNMHYKEKHPELWKIVHPDFPAKSDTNHNNERRKP